MQLLSDVLDLLELVLSVFELVNFRLPKSFLLFSLFFLFLLLDLIIVIHGFQSFVLFAEPVYDWGNDFKQRHFCIDRFLLDLVNRHLKTLLDLIVMVLFL